MYKGGASKFLKLMITGPMGSRSANANTVLSRARRLSDISKEVIRSRVSPVLARRF